MLARVTDATLQIYGGMGLMNDFPIERFGGMPALTHGRHVRNPAPARRDLLRPLGA